MIRTEQDRQLDRLRRMLYLAYWEEIVALGVKDTETLLRMEWLTTDVDKVATHAYGSTVVPAPEGEDGTRVQREIFGVTLLGWREALNVDENHYGSPR